MTVASPSDVYYDPFDTGIDADPYPVYRRLREEAPLYYNEPHDFFAVSRADDVERVLLDNETFISGRGAILDFIRADIEMPPGMFIFEDPPIHTRHRKVLHGVFTPRRVAELEPKIRAFCARSLDAVVGSGRFDFIADLGAQVPMRTIGMLLGIPETEQEAHRQETDRSLRTEPGQQLKPQEGFADGSSYAEYIDWRAERPSDDLMTDLLNAELEEEDGSRRRLTRAEVLTYTTLLASAGAETTGHLISWSWQDPGRLSRPATPASRGSIVDSQSHRGGAAPRIPGPAVRPLRQQGRRVRRPDGARRQRHALPHRLRQPRRPSIP